MLILGCYTSALFPSISSIIVCSEQRASETFSEGEWRLFTTAEQRNGCTKYTRNPLTGFLPDEFRWSNFHWISNSASNWAIPPAVASCKEIWTSYRRATCANGQWTPYHSKQRPESPSHLEQEQDIRQACTSTFAETWILGTTFTASDAGIIDGLT